MKLKADYLDSFGDSVDVVIIGGNAGKGVRKGSFGSFLCAARSSEKEDRLRPICFVGSGFNAKDLRFLSEEINRHPISREACMRRGGDIRVIDRNVRSASWNQSGCVLRTNGGY